MSEFILKPAYFWRCPECGREQFVHAVRSILPPDEEHAEQVRLGIIEPWQEAMPGDLATRPTELRCETCGEEFELDED